MGMNMLNEVESIKILNEGEIKFKIEDIKILREFFTSLATIEYEQQKENNKQ